MENVNNIPTKLPVNQGTGFLSDAAEHGRQIGASVQKTAEQIFNTSDLCLTAQQRYGDCGLPVVLRAAKMQRSTFMKYLSIARDSRLRRIQPLLPASFTTIHLIAQLSDDMFQAAVKAEAIHPDVRRVEIEALRKGTGGKGKQRPNECELPGDLREMMAGSRFEFLVPLNLQADGCAQMRQILHRLCTKYDIQVVAIKELESSPNAVMTPATTSRAGGSPVNRPPAGAQSSLPPRVTASPPPKSSP